MSQSPDFGVRRDFYTFAPESLAQELPEFAIHEELASGVLVPVELPGLPLERRVSVISHPSNPLTATQRAFIDELVETLTRR